MNITPFTIYLWQLADKLSGTLSGLCWFSGMLMIVLCVIWLFLKIECEAEDSTMRRMSWAVCGGVAAWLVCLSTYTLIPSSSTVAMMVIIPEIANSKALQKDVPDIYNAAVDALKKQLTKEVEKP